MEHLHPTKEIRHKFVPKVQDTHYYKKIDSPVGPLILIANETALLILNWGHDIPDLKNDLNRIESGKHHPILNTTEAQLKEYFLGKRKTFDIPLASKGTEFQKRVWQQLRKIPYGQTITYGEQARRLGQPKSARAVGAANGKNPIGIIVPCHRVIGASGCLKGFAGGLDIKRNLLILEGVQLK